MQNAGFEEALASRVDDMLDACTKCGACFTACPIAGPAGLGAADPKAVVSGVLDILRFGKGSAESEKWAKSCMASGECQGHDTASIRAFSDDGAARHHETTRTTERRRPGVSDSARSAETPACCRGCNCPKNP
jgi:Fe-S oxidoreductase